MCQDRGDRRSQAWKDGVMKLVSGKQRKRIEEFFEHVQRTARSAFERDGLCIPVALFLFDDKETVLPLHKLMANKQVTSVLLNKLIEETRPLAFVFVAEVWMARAAGDAAHHAGAPDDLAEKYGGTLVKSVSQGKETPKEGVLEAVMLQCCSVVGDNFMLTAEIIRPAVGKPTAKPWERMENRNSEGRFIFDVVPLVERQ